MENPKHWTLGTLISFAPSPGGASELGADRCGGLDCHGDCARFRPTRQISPTRFIQLHGCDGQRLLDPFGSIARLDGVWRRTAMKFNRQGRFIQSLIPVMPFDAPGRSVSIGGSYFSFNSCNPYNPNLADAPYPLCSFANHFPTQHRWVILRFPVVPILPLCCISSSPNSSSIFSDTILYIKRNAGQPASVGLEGDALVPVLDFYLHIQMCSLSNLESLLIAGSLQGRIRAKY